ncbi:MAG TPA: hypothetical protein VFU11_10180 [Solirubrobacterales bacterium]|nr:hypothetical protein [Solirubrobacterales bacterium]
MVTAILVLASLLAVRQGHGAAQGADRAKAGAATEQGCAMRTADLIVALDELREDLLVGLPYEEYVEEMRRIKRIFYRVPGERMSLSCLTGAAGLAGGALNEYIYAANAWTECISDRRCDLAANEPVIERKFWVAGTVLTSAHQALAGSP